MERELWKSVIHSSFNQKQNAKVFVDGTICVFVTICFGRSIEDKLTDSACEGLPAGTFESMMFLFLFWVGYVIVPTFKKILMIVVIVRTVMIMKLMMILIIHISYIINPRISAYNMTSRRFSHPNHVGTFQVVGWTGIGIGQLDHGSHYCHTSLLIATTWLTKSQFKPFKKMVAE